MANQKKNSSVIADEGEVALAKMLRVLQMSVTLIKGRWTVESLAQKFDTSTRSIYRYLHLMQAVGYVVEKDFKNRYFIAQDNCPLCGKEAHHG